jgi:hypothetical protein
MEWCAGTLPVLALHVLAGAEGTGMPVLDPTSHALVGWITHRTLLTALQPTTPATHLAAKAS